MLLEDKQFCDMHFDLRRSSRNHSRCPIDGHLLKKVVLTLLTAIAQAVSLGEVEITMALATVDGSERRSQRIKAGRE